METIPFTITNVYEGFAEVEGLARLEDDGLVLEFQTKDGIVGLIKSKVNEVRIPLEEIAGVEFQKKMFKASVLLRVRSMSLMSAIPGSRQGEVKLRIPRKHRDAAEELVSELELQRSQQTLRRMDDEMQRLETPDEGPEP